MGSTGQSLQFGVELELLLGGRKKAFSSWRALADDVSKRLAKAGIRNHVQAGRKGAPETYREWSVVPEVTIPSQPAAHLWGVELVSPVYPAGWDWAADVAAVFAAVHAAYTVVPSPHCSTHVHVSGAPRPLPGRAVARLAAAVLYFEPALDALMPPARRQSTAYWCRSNRESQLFQAEEDEEGRGGARRLPLAACLALVRHHGHEASASASAVAAAVNLLPPDCAYGRAHGKTRSFVHGKVFKWNFGHLAKKAGGGSNGAGLGTIEYRQPPGSVAAEEACAWVTLALAFVAGVVLGDNDDDADNDDGNWVAGLLAAAARGGAGDPDAGATLGELWQVLQTGAGALGWLSLGGVEGLFGGINE